MRALVCTSDAALRRRVAERLRSTCRRVVCRSRLSKQKINGLFDLLILGDRNLKQLLSACRQLRKQISCQQIFLLAMCENADPATVQRLLVAGADDVVGWKDGPDHLAIRLDCSARQAAKRNLYDPLTRLPNRILLLEMLKRAIAGARRKGTPPFAVLFLDLDHFKAVNDTFGHAAGDRVLVETGKRLQAIVRAGDVVARVGGDEFVILLTHLRHPHDAERIVARLQAGLSRPVLVRGKKITLSAGIGLVGSEQKFAQAEKYLDLADRMMYRMKGK